MVRALLVLDLYRGLMPVALGLYQDQSVALDLYQDRSLVPAVCSGQRNRPWPESRSSCSSGR